MPKQSQKCKKNPTKQTKNWVETWTNNLIEKI